MTGFFQPPWFLLCAETKGLFIGPSHTIAIGCYCFDTLQRLPFQPSAQKASSSFHGRFRPLGDLAELGPMSVRNCTANILSRYPKSRVARDLESRP
jgi:hypothetical protein